MFAYYRMKIRMLLRQLVWTIFVGVIALFELIRKFVCATRPTFELGFHQVSE